MTAGSSSLRARAPRPPSPLRTFRAFRTGRLWRSAAVALLASMLALSLYGFAAPASIRCGLPGSVACPGGVFGPAVVASGTGEQWFDVVMYDWGFSILDTTTGANETAAWNVYEGWTVHINATSNPPDAAIGGTAYHGLGVEINATGQQLLSLAAPVGGWVSATFVAPNHVYHDQHIWCTIQCGPGHGGQQLWDLNVLPATAFPVPTIASNASSGTAPLAVQFTSNVTLGTPPYNLTWSFGDGTPPAYGTSVAHTYTLGGLYDASLLVTDSKGNTGQATAAITVLSGAPMNATATASPGVGVAPLLTHLTAVAHGGTPPYQYAWAFGDGTNTSGEATVGHIYWAPGTYAALLTVTDAVGSHTVAFVVVNVSSPAGLLSVTANASGTAGNPPYTTTLSANASGGTAPYTYAWLLGDEDTGVGSPLTYTYNTSGSYEAIVVATDAAGWTGAARVHLAVTPVGGGGGGGDGGGDDQPFATTPTTNLTLVVTLSPSSGTAPLAVTDTVSVVGGSGQNESVSWQFGDGSTATGQVVNHTYASAGNYAVRVTSTDSAGTTGSATAQELVGGPSLSIAVSASIGDAPVLVTAAATVLGGSGTFGPVSWNWGDGSTSSGVISSHLYGPNSTGAYTLRATVTDSIGATATGSTPIQIVAGPSAAIVASAPSGSGLPESVTFTLRTSGGTGGFSSQVLWNFGDGTSLRGPPIEAHVFARLGTFNVTATTNDSSGRLANASLTVNITLNLHLPGGRGPAWSFTGVQDPGTAALALLGLVGATGLGFLYRKRSRGRPPAATPKAAAPAPPPPAARRG